MEDSTKNQTESELSPVENTDEKETALCPHCLEPVEPLDHFCPKCGEPVTAYASIDTMGQIYSAGRAYQKATTGKPSRLVVAAMWLIFGPQLLVLINLMGMYFYGLFHRLDTASMMDRWGTSPAWHHSVWDLAKVILMLGLIVLYA